MDQLDGNDDRTIPCNRLVPHRVNKKAIVIGIILFSLIVVGMFIFALLKKAEIQEEVPKDVNIPTQS